jgi:hypothetical protein
MAHMLVPPKMHFQHLLLLDSMLGERHIRHAKVSKKNSSSIFYDNCLGAFFLNFFFPPMTSTNVPLN